MLAKHRGFYKGNREVIRTPLLVPSFSSKGFPHVQALFETSQEWIDGEILISAYDLYKRNLTGGWDFAEAIFLDSGGYEVSKDVELSDIRGVEYDEMSWSIEEYQSVVSGWNSKRPTVIVSYDHPKEKCSTVEQIDRAARTIPTGENIFREILFKPEPDGRATNVSAIVEQVHQLNNFDAVGITEKEIGSNLQSRMDNIARIRQALNSAGLGHMPIHVFGSLDTISTPLFFVAGADIFDGLTWLRFAYLQGMTVYRQNFTALNHGTGINGPLGDALCMSSNLHYLKSMQIEMKGFLRNGSFENFKHHSSVIEAGYHAVMEETEARHGR